MRNDAPDWAVDLLKGARLLTSAASLGDFIYTIRERELQGWDGPKVKAWSDGCQLIESALKKAVEVKA